MIFYGYVIRGLSTEGFKVTIGAAAAALRVLLTVNAGGALALLAFVGAIAGKHKPVFDSPNVFAYPLSLFGSGVILAVFATCCMYFAQGSFMNRSGKQTLTLDFPHTLETSVSQRWRTVGITFQISSIISSLISFCVFVVGIYACRDLVLTAKL